MQLQRRLQKPPLLNSLIPGLGPQEKTALKVFRKFLVVVGDSSERLYAIGRPFKKGHRKDMKTTRHKKNLGFQRRLKRPAQQGNGDRCP